eukprot:GHVL01009879.1.p1 GENE.GHVL01009879.1~~GHVL01009879.1.p1  ORF type:complete len:166 (+),score=20.95 GHVL01009879.1:466-963(+)
MARVKSTTPRSTSSMKKPGAAGARPTVRASDFAGASESSPGSKRPLATSPRKTSTPQKKKQKTGAKSHRKILQEIRFYQTTTDLLIPKAPFVRLIKEIQQPYTRHHMEGFRWTPEALMALQTAAEAYLVGLFSDAILLTYHARRVTLFVQDIRLARRIRGRISDV